jgi:hypothetical protein
MLLEFKLFLFVLSIIYILRFIVELTIRLFQENPDSISLSKIEQLAHYVALSYIITYILI